LRQIACFPRAASAGPPIVAPALPYSFAGKSADQIIEDLERNAIQSEIGGGAFEIAVAAIQAVVARENRRLQLRLTVFSLCL
jgi:hypothetical protein